MMGAAEKLDGSRRPGRRGEQGGSRCMRRDDDTYKPASSKFIEEFIATTTRWDTNFYNDI